MAKTRDEVEELKANWSCDPCWDLEDTEGFEEYADELRKYQEEFSLAAECEREAEEQKERLEAEKLGLYGLYQLINQYGAMLERHQSAIRYLANGESSMALEALRGY